MLWIATLVWAALMVACAPALYRVMTSKAREHDVLGFSFAWVALVMLGFNSRWIFASDSALALDVMRGAGCFLAVFLFTVARFYKKWG